MGCYLPHGLSGLDAIKDIQMFTRKGLFSTTSRSVVLAAVAAVALMAVEPSLALAGSPTTAAKGISARNGVSGATDFSAARRHYRRGGGGQAAALAAFAGVVGTIGGIAAAQSRSDDYYDYDGPAYYSGGPGYYGRAAYASPYGGGYGYGSRHGSYLDPGGNIVPY